MQIFAHTVANIISNDTEAGVFNDLLYCMADITQSVAFVSHLDFGM